MDANDNHVSMRDACPTCGERDADRLVWLDDERVECQRCKTIYEPGRGRHEDQP